MKIRTQAELIKNAAKDYKDWAYHKKDNSWSNWVGIRRTPDKSIEEHNADVYQELLKAKTTEDIEQVYGGRDLNSWYMCDECGEYAAIIVEFECVDYESRHYCYLCLKKASSRIEQISTQDL